MVTYLYKCKVCGAVFEKKLHFNDEEEDITCPNGHQAVQRCFYPTSNFLQRAWVLYNDSKSKPAKKSSDLHRKKGAKC